MASERGRFHFFPATSTCSRFGVLDSSPWPFLARSVSLGSSTVCAHSIRTTPAIGICRCQGQAIRTAYPAGSFIFLRFIPGRRAPRPTPPHINSSSSAPSISRFRSTSISSDQDDLGTLLSLTLTPFRYFRLVDDLSPSWPDCPLNIPLLYSVLCPCFLSLSLFLSPTHQ